MMVKTVGGTVLRNPSASLIFKALFSLRSAIAIFFKASLRGVNVCFFIKQSLWFGEEMSSKAVFSNIRNYSVQFDYLKFITFDRTLKSIQLLPGYF